MTIGNIERHDPAVNVGRLEQIFFMFQDDVTSLNEVTDVYRRDVVTNGNISMKNGAALFSLYFTPKSENFRETATISKNGKFYEQRLTLNIPQDREAVAQVLQAIYNNKVFIYYKDRNGKKKLLQNMRLTETVIVSRTDNSCEVSLEGKSKVKSKFWNIDGEVEVSDDSGTIVLENNSEIAFERHEYYGNGSTASFNYNTQGGTTTMLLVYREGLLLRSTDYTDASGDVTFSYVPFSNEHIVIVRFYNL